MTELGPASSCFDSAIGAGAGAADEGGGGTVEAATEVEGGEACWEVVVGTGLARLTATDEGSTTGTTLLDGGADEGRAEAAADEVDKETWTAEDDSMVITGMLVATVSVVVEVE